MGNGGSSDNGGGSDNSNNGLDQHCWNVGYEHGSSGIDVMSGPDLMGEGLDAFPCTTRDSAAKSYGEGYQTGVNVRDGGNSGVNAGNQFDGSTEQSTCGYDCERYVVAGNKKKKKPYGYHPDYNVTFERIEPHHVITVILHSGKRFNMGVYLHGPETHQTTVYDILRHLFQRKHLGDNMNHGYSVYLRGQKLKLADDPRDPKTLRRLTSHGVNYGDTLHIIHDG